MRTGATDFHRVIFGFEALARRGLLNGCADLRIVQFERDTALFADKELAVPGMPRVGASGVSVQ